MSRMEKIWPEFTVITELLSSYMFDSSINEIKRHAKRLYNNKFVVCEVILSAISFSLHSLTVYQMSRF